MISVMGLVQQFAINRILSAGAPVSHKSKAVLGLAALAGFILLLGFVFFIYAINLWLNTAYEPHIAATITGAICVVLSLLCVICLYLIMQFKKSRVEKFQDETIELVKSITEMVDVEMRDLIDNNPKTAVAVASIAGILLGKRFL